MSDDAIINVPFTDEQVAMLKRHQENPYRHPYTCTCGADLEPTSDGLKCPECDYLQTWAHNA